MKQNGTYYVIGEGHKGFVADKQEDDDTYIMTLAAIAKELEARGLTEAKIHLAVGLPLKWVQTQRDGFKRYLTRERYVSLKYKKVSYLIEIVDCTVMPQGYAAVAENLKDFKGMNLLVDIGNGTMNIMYLNNGRPIESKSWTEKLGVNQCFIRIQNHIMNKTGVKLPDEIISQFLRCGEVALYPQIYQIENLMREVLNEVMNKQYGTTWWDTFAPTKMKETHSKRMKEFKAKVPSFNDVDEKLMCIDISDLSELMTLKRYCWKPAFDGKISGMLNGVQTYKDGIVREQLLKQREIEVDLWGEQFSKYFPDDFIERYCALARDRNHIMHNKLLDRSVYVSIKESAEQIQEDLVKALEKLHNIILSKEEKFEVEKQRQIEMQMLEELDHECRENDANVSIRNRFEIKFMFVDCLNSFVGDVEEHLRFRNDITISLDDSFHKSYMGSVMLIKSNIDDSVLELKFEMDIDDSEGADSALSIYDTDKEFRTQLVYTNGAVEYDYDSGLYMPITQDEIGSVEEMVNDFMEVINEEIPYYKERVCDEDIAEFVTCSECGDDAICINEDVLPAGTCMNCGYVNNIYQCERCSSWFNIDEGGMFEDDIAICQNCLEDYEEE